MKHLVSSVLIALALSATAAEPDAVAKREIEHLIGYLAASGCQFNRNGTWHTPSRAVSHLRRKYEYLLDRKLVPTAESFIENAASASSSSGKPYVVRCSGNPDVQSGPWFRAELARFREESGNSSTQH
jgi:hypothetical protein